MDGKQQCKIRPQDQAAHSIWSLYEWRFQRYGPDKIVAEKKKKKKEKKNELEQSHKASPTGIANNDNDNNNQRYGPDKIVAEKKKKKIK